MFCLLTVTFKFFFVVTEFMANGSLDHFLRGKDARGEDLGWPRIVDMLRGIAAGMKYLTDKGFVHRVRYIGSLLLYMQMFNRLLL